MMKRYLARWSGYSRQPVTAMVAISLLAAGLYLVGPSSNYIYADDTMPNAIRVWGGKAELGTLEAERWMSAHHLVLPILHQTNRLVGLNGPGDLSTTQLLIRIYVALLSALTLFSVGLLLHRWTGSLGAGLLGMATTASTYGFWAYSIVTDFYVPAAAFALLAILLADLAASPRHRILLLLLSSAAVVSAALNHQSHSLVAIPIFASLLLHDHSSLSLSKRVAHATVFLIPTVILGFGAFYVAFLFDDRGIDFLRFVFGYAGREQTTPYTGFQILTPVYALVGFLRTVVFLDYVQAIKPAREFIETALVLKATFDDWYLIHSLPRLVLYSSLGMVTISSLLMVRILPTGLLEMFRRSRSHAGFFMILGWMAVQTMFTVWWRPLSNEFWIWITPCMGILYGMFMVRTRALGHLSWVLVFCLMTSNGIAISRYWSSDNCIYLTNKAYHDKLESKDLVLAADYFNSQDLHHVTGLRAHRLNFYRGLLTFDNENLRRELVRVESESGAVYLDPMFTMPARQEINAFEYRWTKEARAAVDRELLNLEEYCQQNGIPLYGVRRRGAEVISVEKRTFGGYLIWVDHDLARSKQKF